MEPVALSDQLDDLSRQLQHIPEAEEPPLTTLEVLGRSSVEQDWQRLFFYFLNPEQPHGLGTAVLEHVLSELSGRDDLDFSFSTGDLESVHVDQEVVTAGGRPDGVIWVEDKWFICWELKVGAAEGDD